MLTALREGCRAAAAGPFWNLLGILLLFALAAAWMAFRRLARARFIEDTPASTIRSAAQGYVELQGRAQLLPGPDIVCPLSGTRCVWWSYTIEERSAPSENGNRSDWNTIEAATSDDLFVIRDTDGECIVDPVGATVVPSLRRSWYGYTERPGVVPATTSWFPLGNYRYSERLLQFNDYLYASGWFRTQGKLSEFDERRDVAELLAEWKRDRAELLRRFDTDRSGDIDQQEWEAARAAAVETVRARALADAVHPELDVLCRPPDRRPFVLSSQTPERQARRARSAAAVWLVFAVFAAGAALLALRSRGLI